MQGRTRLAALAAAFVALALALPASASARDAHLDPAFGDGGWVTTTIPGEGSLAYAGIVLRNGKTAVAGQAFDDNGNSQIVVARYRRDGTPDPGFGEDGVFTSSFPEADGPFLATSIAQPRNSRKLVIGGGYGQGSMLALRLTHGGRLDGSFGSDGPGKTVVPAGGIGQSLMVNPFDGSILLGGSNANANGRPMVVARLQPDGTPDTGYGTGGQAQILFWNPTLAASAGVSAMYPTPAGGMVGFGHLDYIGSDGHGSAGIFKLTPTGQLVQRYGTAGHTEVDFELKTGVPAFWFPCAMGVDGTGRVTVTGDGTGNTGSALLTTRLTPGGVPDPTFGRAGTGTVMTEGLPDGDFTTCGATGTANDGLIAGVGSTLVHLTARGARRSAFGPGGMVEIAQPQNVAVNAVARVESHRGPDSRRIVVAGSAGNDIYVARYLVPPPR